MMESLRDAILSHSETSIQRIAMDEPGAVAASHTLHMCAENDGAQHLVDLLVKLGADVNQFDESGVAPLHLMVANGRVHGATQLLALGAAVDAPTRSRGDTSLHIAARARNQEMMELLLAFGADADAANSEGERPYGAARMILDTDVL